MVGKVAKRVQNDRFAFRVKMGEYEVEIVGKHPEVLKAIMELPRLMSGVYDVFEEFRPKTKATLTVKKSARARTQKEETPVQKSPKIPHTESCSEAVLSILETDWGKWRPRTIDELKEALKANGLQYSGRTLAGVLLGLVNKKKVRRWKTDAGCVYILAEKEVLA